jgi:acyl-CoA synthetase (AMP-forming)/AMP-acid ligase II
VPDNLRAQIAPPSDKAAIVVDGAILTYSDLHDAVDAVAAKLQTLGLQPGARVGITGLGPGDLLVAVYGCLGHDLTAVPITGGDADRNAAALDAAGVEAMIDGSLDPMTIVGPSHTRQPEVAMIVHTSGTTAASRKGVLIGHASIGATCAFMNRAMALESDVVEVVFAPLDHAFGLGRCHSVLSVGGTVLLSTGLRLGDLFTWLEDGATALSTTPSTLAALLTRRPTEFGEAAQSIRWLQTGAMRFDKSLRDQLCDLLPNAGIFAHYGLSEAMRTTFMDLQAHPDKRHTEGPAADGVLIEIRDPATGSALPLGEEGAIAVSGSNLCLGYTDDALWQAACVDGWYVTNDLGRLDEDGYLVFAGRSDDVINANGNIVHPDEIESRLAALLGATPFSVVGVADPDGVRDAVVVLCVEGDDPPALRDVRAAMKTAPDFMTPKHVVRVAQIPRTGTGKVSRARLAAEVAPVLG